MTWKITTRPLFEDWFEEQNEAVQEETLSVLNILREYGPYIGRPQVDTLKDSQYRNMKELRIQVGGHPIRICFVFDPMRKGVILCAGNKKGHDEKRFYSKLIRLADMEYSIYLKGIYKI
ncbi:MAG: type II toxin-antitoxin system RelE/ParE family toxin [Providencia heimbachae]|nr:type II toxin-antitoxin system RelE/ParE family toxin [Providencia heimbachae]